MHRAVREDIHGAQWSLERSRDIVNMPHSRHFNGRRTKKNLSYPLTNVMHTMYLVTLYGDAARGRYHSGDGPDSAQRPISHNRQRREGLVIGARRRNPWVTEEVVQEKSQIASQQGTLFTKPWNLGSVSLGEGGKS